MVGWPQQAGALSAMGKTHRSKRLDDIEARRNWLDPLCSEVPLCNGAML